MDVVFNVAKGSVAEKVRDDSTKLGVLLLVAKEADGTIEDHATVADLLAAAGNTEASDASYARKTAITGTVTVDDTNNRVDVDIPDQEFTDLEGAAIVALVVFYEEAAADATRIPLTKHDVSVTPDGTTVTFQINAAGFFRAQAA